MKGKFLVASANGSAVKVIQATLPNGQHQVIVVADGLEAVDRALDHRPDAILASVRLPGLGGLDVARALRALDPTEHVPIIFLAESIEEAKQVYDARLSLIDCVTAPFIPAEVQARVEAALRTHENAAALRSRDPDTLLAILDPLTRLYNRRYLLHALAYEAARSARYKSALSVLMVDVDNLEAINQKYGILTGDNVLVEVGRLVKAKARGSDIVGRADKQDFLVLAPQTDPMGARVLADRLRETISEHHFVAEKLDLHVTVSIGVACADGADLAENLALLGRAEGALDHAKRAGKNRVEVD
ncbi:MAG: diguanylate cyclase [Chloroflexota bacterium]|nr:diguanylate cyclase [Chloroflexota bacterium]